MANKTHYKGGLKRFRPQREDGSTRKATEFR